MAQKLRADLGDNGLNKRGHEGSVTLITTGDLESFKKQTDWFKYKDRAEYKNIVLDYSKYNEQSIEEYEELQPAA